MCFAVPLKVKKVRDGKLVMEDGRVVKSLISGKVGVGDYLVCQQDMGVEKISKKEALLRRKAVKGVSDEISKRPHFA